MLNYLPHYITCSKALHHLALFTYGRWRIPFVRNRIVKGFDEIRKADLQRKLIVLLGDLSKELFVNEEENRVILNSAEKALCHEFDILGSGPIHLEPLQWNKDLKTGFEWKNGIYATRQCRQVGNKGSDVKQPWELSRCHHLLWLGEAYLITRKEEYAQAVVADIENWIEQNPFFYSINWTCSMEVAIRAVNWMYAVLMVAGSDKVTDAFVAKFYKSLYQHGFFIYTHLEKSFPYSNNHYASNIVGLLYLGLLFKEETKREWYDFALLEFCIETRNQILPSGVHFEKSVSYHRLMTELLGFSYYLLKRNNEIIPEDIAYRIKTMFVYVDNYSKSNGKSPLLEDNDNGRFLPFVERDFREHSYLCMDSIELRIIANGLPLLYKVRERETRLYEDAGIAIIQTPELYLAVTCSGRDKYSEHIKRKKVGCHMHNDLLSFEFAVDRNDVFIDPGSYIYTADLEKRNEFRSTRKHNTVVIDGEEQNILMLDDAFEVERNSRVVSFDLNDSVDEPICKGSYKLIQSGVLHGRAFRIKDNHLQIEDTLEKYGKAHTAKLYFHCAEGLQPYTDGKTIWWVTSPHHYTMSFNSTNETNIEIINDTVSPSYGVLRSSKTIVITVPFDNKLTITTNIEWKEVIE